MEHPAKAIVLPMRRILGIVFRFCTPLSGPSWAVPVLIPCLYQVLANILRKEPWIEKVETIASTAIPVVRAVTGTTPEAAGIPVSVGQAIWFWVLANIDIWVLRCRWILAL